MKDLQSEVNVTKQEKVDINEESLKKDPWSNTKLEVTRSRVSPGVLLKNFSSLQWRVRSQLKECLDSGFVSS